MRFAGVRVFKINIGRFKKGAAISIPKLCIIVGKGFENDTQLLMHEYGHILQYEKWGFSRFWKDVAPTSFRSALGSKKYNLVHMQTWTEWSANRLAYHYFGKPKDWQMKQYPISPSSENSQTIPTFARNLKDFEKNFLDVYQV